MFSGGIVVSPVDYAALFIPFVFAIEFHGVACVEGADAGGKINIVSHEEGLTGAELEQEFLVSAAVVIICQNSVDFAGALDLEIARAVLKGVGEGLIAGGAGWCCVCRCATDRCCIGRRATGWCCICRCATGRTVIRRGAGDCCVWCGTLG